jgi:hypothetical protein
VGRRRQYAYAREWTTRQDRRIAENAHWVLASSVIRSAVSDDTVSLDDELRRRRPGRLSRRRCRARAIACARRDS